MEEHFPQFRHRLMHNGGIEWRGVLQPTPDSPEYHVRIVHDPGGEPRTYIDRPKLRPHAPHMYRGDVLCLYWPMEWRWRPDESLADTIVPWIAFWLYYYEIWLVTDEWLGPSSPHGLHPDRNKHE